LAVKLKSFEGLWRMGSGEFSDSLALDNISEYSKKLVPFSQNIPMPILNLKPKVLKLKTS